MLHVRALAPASGTVTAIRHDPRDGRWSVEIRTRVGGRGSRVEVYAPVSAGLLRDPSREGIALAMDPPACGRVPPTVGILFDPMAARIRPAGASRTGERVIAGDLVARASGGVEGVALMLPSERELPGVSVLVEPGAAVVGGVTSVALLPGTAAVRSFGRHVAELEEESEKDEGDPRLSRPPIVVIATPHSACPRSHRSVPRSCDLAAYDAARSIARALSESGAARVRWFPSNVPRRACDLNRPSARGTRYRTTLDDYLRTNRDAIAALLDLHSFPSYEEDGEPIFSAADVAILDDRRRGRAYGSLAEDLRRALTDAGFDAVLVTGVDNDIQDAARDIFGIPATLIEFNEDLLQHPRELRSAAAAVAQEIAELLSSADGIPPPDRSSAEAS